MKIRLWTLLVFVFSFSLTANGQVFLAGVEDDFALPVEAATPSQELDDLLIASQGAKDFDATTVNADVAHTFVSLPANIIDATLEFAVRGISDTTESDGIFLSFVNTETTDLLDAIVYVRTFGVFGGSVNPPFTASDPGLVQSSAWSSGNEATVTLDLSALPLAGGGTLDLLSQLNSNGYLDVVVAEDSAVDFMKLTTVVIPVIPGDVNGNGWVAGEDLGTVIAYWGQTGLGREYGDLNGNGTVDGGDYTEVLSYWGTGTQPTEPPGAIPEPTTLALLAIVGLVLVRRRIV